MIAGGRIVLHPGSRLWLGAISDPAKRSPRGGIASPTRCLSRERQGWVDTGESRWKTQHILRAEPLRCVGSALRLTQTYAATAQYPSFNSGKALSSQDWRGTGVTAAT